MLKNKSTLEVKVADRIYYFLCDDDSPLGEAFDVLSQMRAYVIDLIQKSESKPYQEQSDKVIND